MIAIIDYGMGNLHSVKKVVESFGAESCLTNHPEDILRAEKIILPGVGAFQDAAEELAKNNLLEMLKAQIKAQKVFLGICLGMQLLFEGSAEAPGRGGLAVIKGTVKKFAENSGVKVPHMGWNQLKIIQNQCPLFKDVADNAFVYFCHSYFPQPKEKAAIAASTVYGIDFSSVIWKKNIFGLQFHPEKSQVVGLRILENFIKI